MAEMNKVIITKSGPKEVQRWLASERQRERETNRKLISLFNNSQRISRIHLLTRLL